MNRKLDKESLKTAQLGDQVVTAYEDAAHAGRGLGEVALLATRVVVHMLRHARRTWAPRRNIATNHHHE